MKVEWAKEPAVCIVVASEGKDVEMWPLYDGITCPTLLLRGETSDLLTHETALQMTGRGPCAKLVEVSEVGHAPMLMNMAQVTPIREFLLG